MQFKDTYSILIISPTMENAEDCENCLYNYKSIVPGINIETLLLVTDLSSYSEVQTDYVNGRNIYRMADAKLKNYIEIVNETKQNLRVIVNLGPTYENSADKNMLPLAIETIDKVENSFPDLKFYNTSRKFILSDKLSSPIVNTEGDVINNKTYFPLIDYDKASNIRLESSKVICNELSKDARTRGLTQLQKCASSSDMIDQFMAKIYSDIVFENLSTANASSSTSSTNSPTPDSL